LSDPDNSIPPLEIEATRATARLPGLDIEIVHRRSPGGDAEQISINLQAVPSFEAFGRYIDSSNPFMFWARAMQMAWLPWYTAMLGPNLMLSEPPETPARSVEGPGTSM